MTTHGSVAKAVRERKEKHPELYCRLCQWMTGGGNCHRHGGPAWTPARAEAAGKRSRGEGLTVEEWTLLGVKLPIELPSAQHDIDARCQPVKSRPDGYR